MKTFLRYLVALLSVAGVGAGVHAQTPCRLAVTGRDRVCVTAAAEFATSPAVPADWTVYSIDGGDFPVAQVASQPTLSFTFPQAGKYRVVARSGAYCEPAVFAVSVVDAPPAPTVAQMGDNPREACPYGSIGLGAASGNPDLSFVWVPECAGVAPGMVSGDEVSFTYNGTVCDIDVYTYDKVLGCLSVDPLVHHVDELALAEPSIPQQSDACPGTVISWQGGEVPYQEGVLYTWTVREDKQYCASVQGSALENGIDLTVHELGAYPDDFYMKLKREYCGLVRYDTFYIHINDQTPVPITLTASQTDTCPGEGVTFNAVSSAVVTVTSENTLSPSNTCNNTPIRLTASVTPPMAVNETTWSFGDGSSFTMSGNSICHTFASGAAYSVTATIHDSSGCPVRSTPLSIISHNNNLIFNTLVTSGSPVCLGGTRLLHYPYFGYVMSGVSYSWNHASYAVVNPYSTGKPGNNCVQVVNQNFCHDQAQVNVAFLNTPTAEVTTDKAEYCQGERVTMYGATGPDSVNCSYEWVVTNQEAGFLLTLATATASFVADIPGSYHVSLCVTDNGSQCSSCGDADIKVHETPAAPDPGSRQRLDEDVGPTVRGL